MAATTTRCPTCAKPLGETLGDKIISVIAQMMAVTGQPVTYSYLRDKTGGSPQGTVNALSRLRYRGAIEKVSMDKLAGWALTPHALEELVDPTEADLIHAKAAQAAQERIDEIRDPMSAIGGLLDRARGAWSAGGGLTDHQAREYLMREWGVGESTAEEALWTRILPGIPIEVDSSSGVLVPTGDGWWSEMRQERTDGA